MCRDFVKDTFRVWSRTHRKGLEYIEIACFIYDKQTVFFVGDNSLDEAIYQLDRSLQVCKGTMWYTNERDRNILHEDCCVKLCETLLRLAKIESVTDPKTSADLAYRAGVTVTEGWYNKWQ